MPKDNKDALISVVVVTKDRFPELCDCLRSLLNQDYPYFEIIVIDCSSKNNSVMVREHFPEIKYYNIEHKGISNSRNKGISYLRGEYAAFIDDDCIAKRDWLRKLYESAIKNKADITGGDAYFSDGYTRQASIYYVSAFGDFKSSLTDSNIDRNVYKFIGFPGLNMLIKRQAFLAINFDEYYKYFYDETDFCVRAQLAGFKLVHSPEAIVIHNMSPKGYQRKELKCRFRNPPYFVAKNFGISCAYLIDIFIRTLKTIKAYYNMGQRNIILVIVPNVILGMIDGLKARRKTRRVPNRYGF